MVMCAPYILLIPTENAEPTSSLVYLYKRPVLKQHEGYFGTHFVILNRGQMTRTTLELAPPSPNFCTTLERGRLATTYNLAYNRPIPGLESRALRL
ncbi:hypothetical protein AVEN_18400-1 [Araneus ventricosus]|uniref:Uncharacterized protein n=1 Tax=Araneus ventricosus TaxID=182803 RepID=A0A4Y2QPS0_ARAVE|nr:hypothetical protein AVEN_18400-1 [Araneus ventricosus]